MRKIVETKRLYLADGSWLLDDDLRSLMSCISAEKSDVHYRRLLCGRHGSR